MQEMFRPSRTLLDQIGFGDSLPMIISVPSLKYRGGGSEAEEMLSMTLTELVTNTAKVIYGERYSNEHNQFVIVNIFLEQFVNCSEHGNNYDHKKYVTVGIWFGKKGILFAFRDEGSFFSLESTKNAMESRKKIDTTRVHPSDGGNGIGLLYEAATDIFVATEEKTLYVTYVF